MAACPKWKESFEHEAFIDPQRPLLFFEAQVSEKLFCQSSSNQHCQFFSKPTALKRTNFSFNILSQLQFQNINQTGLSNLLVLWTIFRKKFLLPFVYRSSSRIPEKNMLIATFLETKWDVRVFYSSILNKWLLFVIKYKPTSVILWKLITTLEKKVFFCVNSWQFYPSPKMFYKSAIRDKFHVYFSDHVLGPLTFNLKYTLSENIFWRPEFTLSPHWLTCGGNVHTVMTSVWRGVDTD